MDQATSRSQADRALRLFLRLSQGTEDLGLVRAQIEDDQFLGDRITLRGKTVLNFGLASYLGLGDDERLRAAAKDALDRYGTSYSSSISYTSVPLYGELDERLSKMMDANGVIAPSTTLAHLAALPVLIRPGDTVVMDARVHASVQMATQVLQATGIEVVTTPHNSIREVEKAVLLKEDGDVWYLTDGIFSMDGDIAPALEIHNLLERYEHFHAYVDDAHGFSWEGKHGRGTYLDRAPWHERLVISAGLSKSFGATGGFVATLDPELAYMIQIAGAPLVFGGPVPPAALGAGIASADIHLTDELAERQAQLDERISFVNRFASDIGLPLTAKDHTPIWFLDTGEASKATALLGDMKEAGFYLNGAIFPVVPRGHAGARFTITLYHSIEQIESMLTCLYEKALEHIGVTEIFIDIDQIAQGDSVDTESSSESTDRAF